MSCAPSPFHPALLHPLTLCIPPIAWASPLPRHPPRHPSSVTPSFPTFLPNACIISSFRLSCPKVSLARGGGPTWALCQVPVGRGAPWGLPAFCPAPAILSSAQNAEIMQLIIRTAYCWETAPKCMHSQLPFISPADSPALLAGRCASAFFCLLHHAKAHRLYAKPVLPSLVKLTQSTFITPEQNSQGFSYAILLCKSCFPSFGEWSKSSACPT